ncbi:DUF4832 domain-containing protein [Tautonia plasticadhaerens]|uniref:Uncharacterized protein n=1 Tax=Tautonia plasticadhaerens TaxID=2527974 RepID=A0A518H0T2_9BACT|nr:DUF4832 domain-containing protein [Tautonia plasticadhaerens]QDV34459.1 hypothetical protein ElP_23480 [Tautonia plasticadhaerens]
MNLHRPLILSIAALIPPADGRAGDDATRIALQYAPSPADNPLKGLVPYAGQGGRFPHSLEFDYVGLGEVMTGYDAFDWAPLDARLDAIAGRGHQAIFRVYLEYPGRLGILPEFLLRDGLAVHRYEVADTDGKQVETPDYEDERLRRALASFIAAMGDRYDGDPRLGFLTAGLLGHWGEWHTYPREELFASREVQREVLDAFEAAFESTPVLLRYPAGDDDGRMAPNARRPFGYHDDSFAWATLETGRRQDSWFYMALLRAAGPEALDAWKTRPIGGEIRPEAWGRVFDEDPGDPRIQDFRRCVEQTHASWLMDSGMSRRGVPDDRRRRAEAEVRRMGYEFHATTFEHGPAQSGKIPVAVTIENRGVAPFYADWRPEFGLIADGREVVPIPADGSLAGLLPGDPPRRWSASIATASLPEGGVTLALRVPNPMPGGLPVRFANASQDLDRPGWLSLGPIGR